MKIAVFRPYRTAIFFCPEMPVCEGWLSRTDQPDGGILIDRRGSLVLKLPGIELFSPRTLFPIEKMRTCVLSKAQVRKCC